MQWPENVPIERYCRNCGTELEVTRAYRRELRGLFRRRLFRMDTECPRCGIKDSWGRRSIAVLRSSHLPKNPLVRLLFRLRRLPQARRSARVHAQMGERIPHLRADGGVDFAATAAAQPFPLYGLKGRPFGLRLHGTGGGGGLEGRTHTNLRYASGPARDPERALYVKQGPGVLRPLSEYYVMLNFLGNYAPRQNVNAFQFHATLNRDWNMERIQQASRERMSLTIGGSTVEAEVASWDDPYPVVLLARLTIVGNPLLVASLNLSRQEMAAALSALVSLREDHEALAEHQRGLDEVRHEQREYHDRFLT